MLDDSRKLAGIVRVRGVVRTKTDRHVAEADKLMSYILNRG